MWVADAAHGRLIRVIEGGSILQERRIEGAGALAQNSPHENRGTIAPHPDGQSENLSVSYAARLPWALS